MVYFTPVASGHIWIYGIIGTKPKGDTNKWYSFDDFQRDLDPQASDYIVHIYSPGGDVFQGQAIYNGLINTGKKIKVQIEGVCASIATLIAGAGDEIVMNESSQFMIHNPRFDSISGDANALRTGADQLDQIKTLLISVYLKRTGLPESQLWQMYDNETWMLPTRAKELGFVDEVVQTMKAVAFADLFPSLSIEYSNLKNMEDNKTILSKLDLIYNKVVNFLNPKNMTATLSDGTVIQVETEDGDWTGKSVTREDGSELPPGTYTLEDGRSMTVTEGKIAEIKEIEAQAENKEDMELKEKLAASEARIKELESALNATTEVATKAEARAKSAENKVNVDLKNLQQELEAIKTQTAGDTTPPKKAVINAAPGQVEDPMTQWYKKNIFDVRNTD